MNGNSPVFVLLTDFGLADPYAGQLRAALFSRAPLVPILDLTHGVPPFAVATGAFFLAASREQYPEGAIFICVVDPGVGSERDLLCIDGSGHTLLGPDNGLLALAYRDMRSSGQVSVRIISPEKKLSAATFHGRDILALAAAALALGEAHETIAPRTRHSPAMPAWTEPAATPEGVTCTVLHVDRFGNCILNLPGNSTHFLSPSLSVTASHSRREFSLLVGSHYAELPPGVVGLLPGSQGYFELACDNASAASLLGLTTGMTCRISRNPL